MQIILICLIYLISLINILSNLAPDSLPPIQITLGERAWRLFKLVYLRQLVACRNFKYYYF